jgi:hypothetical protein
MSEEDRSKGSELLVRTWSDGEAAMLRQILESYGIPCQVVSDFTHTVLPLTVDGLGEIRIFVPAGRLDEARELLAAHRRQGLEIVEGGRGKSVSPWDDDEEDLGPEEATDER